MPAQSIGARASRRSWTAPVAISVCSIVPGTWKAQAQDAADFYRGKTSTINVGASPSGAYVIYARLVARHIASSCPDSRQR